MAYYYRPPTIRRVRIADPLVWSIQVTWTDGEQDIVSLNPILEKRGTLRRRFERNPEKFWDVSVVDHGRAISWFNASIDISAEAISDLIYQQRKITDLASLYDSNIPVPIDIGHAPALLLETLDNSSFLLLQTGDRLLLEH